jgi:hypothetical protein
MSKKTSAVIFAAGAVAGWALAQRIAGTQEAPFTYSEPQPAPPQSYGSDPFRDAFREAELEVGLHAPPRSSWEAA